MDSLIINRQWSNRPADERFVSLTDLHNRNLSDFHKSQQKVIDLKSLTARPCEADTEGLGLEVVGPNGKPAAINSWAFKQLATKLEVQPSFLPKLPAKIASDVINWGLSNAASEKVNMLVTKASDTDFMIRSITGEKYGRIWNHQISMPLVERFGDGISGDWRVPGEFGKEVPVTIQNTTLYAGEQDMFVCLVDEKNRIEMPNRRNGLKSDMARGFIVTNSEVGAGVIALYFFTFDYICRNRTIWGLGDVKEIKLRHTSGAPDRWFDELAPAIENYGMVKASAFEQRMIAAQNTMLDKPAEEILKNKLAMPVVTDKMVKGIVKAFQMDEMPEDMKGPVIEGEIIKAKDMPVMRTVFDLTVGVTAFARSIPFQNERVALERAAGKFLDMVA